MRARIFWTAISLMLCAGCLHAQDGIRRGIVRRVDAARRVVTIAADGTEAEYRVTMRTRVLGPNGAVPAGNLEAQGIKPGTAVMFKAAEEDGQQVLVGLKAADVRPAPLPRADTSSLVPLTELGAQRYHGYEGGLYPGGRNQPPAAHEAAGLALAKTIRPLDAEGQPAVDGKIVLLSVGMSNTTMEFQAFKTLADADRAKNPKLVIVDGAQGGKTASLIQSPDETYWTVVDIMLRRAGVSRAQVQAAWIKEADAGPTSGFPAYARTLQEELGNVVRLLHERFPNLKLAYLSSRIYGGYATTRLNPEPYAYESAFAVKWLIEQQIKGDAGLNYRREKGMVKAPWLGWGPYLWANGTHRRADGLTYAADEFGADGTHPAGPAQRKVANLLLRFFTTDPTTKGWFTAKPVGPR